MKLIDILNQDTVKIPLDNTDKYKIIEEMVDILYKANKLENRNVVLKSVIEREKIMSTGVGDGVAIPHGKSEGVTTLVACFGVTKNDVDFESIDTKPVRLVFLLVGPPEMTGPHLKALSRISRLMHLKDFREKLIKCKANTEVIEAIQKEEEKYFDI